MKIRPAGLWTAVLLAGASAWAQPVLTPGQWANITPPGLDFTVFGVTAFGVAIDPSDPAVLYFHAGAGGLWKSVNGGSTWTSWNGNLPTPLGLGDIRVDPRDRLHMYTHGGVTGSPASGFWVSHDGGVTWSMPQAFSDGFRTGPWNNDVGNMSVEPADFNHVLLTFHSPWADGNSGVLESKDGGNTWIPHAAAGHWDSSPSIDFLEVPSLGVGNGDTWLLGAQWGGGYWRTSDGGATWTQVSTLNMSHGGNHIFYSAKSGAWYGGSLYQIIRSADNGVTWTAVADSMQDGYECVFGDGNFLYSQTANAGQNTVGPQSYIVSPEGDGTTWVKYTAQTFNDGPRMMAFDGTNRIMYSVNWNAGLWALRVLDSTSTPSTPPVDPPANLAASPAGGGVSISWQYAASNEDGFSIERTAAGGTSYVQIALTGPSARSYLDPVTAPGAYTYRMRAYKGSPAAYSYYSGPAAATVAGPAPQPQPQPQPQGGGSSPAAGIPAVLLSPGLADGMHDVVSFATDDQEVVVVDAAGRKVFEASAGLGPLSWDGRDGEGRPLPTGMYVARLRKADGEVRHEKILIAR